MAQFRKKPVVIEAVQWNQPGGFSEVPDWIKAALAFSPGTAGSVIRMGDDLDVWTLEGKMTARPGDWLIRGIKGEVYPCKPDIFSATYEPAEDTSGLRGQYHGHRE